MKKHGLLMILCCALPLLLIALLPGIRESGGIIGFLCRCIFFDNHQLYPGRICIFPV